MKSRMSRRRFLHSAMTVGAGLTILPAGLARGYAANEKLNVALVGVGGRGQWFVDTIPRMERVVAVCDVNDEKIAEAQKHWEEFGSRYANSSQDWERRTATEFQRLAQNPPKAYRDFRTMLDEMGGQIDAVVVATPDHTHAVASAAAMRAGKHVFCEKPLTRTVHESRALRELARAQRVATSMGNQGTYSGPFRRAAELIRSGAIGEVQEVHVWNSGGGADRREPPDGNEPVPPHLDWDLWLGPAADRPYHRAWLQRHSWRDFGTCQLGNWASHSANLGFLALKVHELWLGDMPGPRSVRVEAKSSGINRLSFPKWEIVTWDVPARPEFPPIRITWYNGEAPGIEDLLAEVLKDAPDKDRNNWRFAGTLIVGSKGTIHTTGHNMWFHLLPGRPLRGNTVQSTRDAGSLSRSGAGLVRRLPWRQSAPGLTSTTLRP